MLYDYRCKQCGKEIDAINKIADRHTNAPDCHGKMELFIKFPSQVHIPMDIRYKCPVTREGITTKRKRRYIMDKFDLVDANDIVNEKSIANTVKKHEEMQALVDHGPDEVRRQVEKLATQI